MGRARIFVTNGLALIICVAAVLIGTAPGAQADSFYQCLDVQSSGTANGTPVWVYDCNGTAAQVWVESNGSLRNPHSSKCLDSNTMATGKELRIYTCNGTDAQKWTSFRDSDEEFPGYRNPKSGKCIDGNDRATGRLAIVYPCNHSMAQWWALGTQPNVNSLESPETGGQYIQLGTGSVDTSTATGARTTMTAPALGPNYATGVPDRFYWLGVTFSDGSFYQVGYRDAALNSDCAGLQWFVANFDADGNFPLYVKGGCGVTGTQTFTIQRTGSKSDGRSVWSAFMGTTKLPGADITIWPSQLPSGAAGVVSEVSTTSTFHGPPGLPAVTYSPAVQVQRSGAWVSQTGGREYRGNGDAWWTPCPPYYLKDLGNNAVQPLLASSGTCLTEGAVLW